MNLMNKMSLYQKNNFWINASIVGFLFILLHLVLDIQSDKTNMGIQISGLIIILILARFQTKTSGILVLVNYLVPILLYSLITNSFLWAIYPSSELQSIISFFIFIINNNFIGIIGISILLILR